MSLLLLLACAHRPGAGVGDCVPAASTVESFRLDRLADGPMLGRFSVGIRTREDQVQARGNLLVDPAGRFRLDVSGPVGPPQLVVASDGAALSAYVAGKKRFYAAPDAAELLTRASGGGLGPTDVGLVLLGALPGALGAAEGGAARWTSPEGAWVAASLACNGALRTLEAGKSPEYALKVEVEPGRRTPEALTVVVPSLGAEVALRFEKWEPASPPETVFRLEPAPGFEVLDLATTLLEPKPQ